MQPAQSEKLPCPIIPRTGQVRLSVKASDECLALEVIRLIPDPPEGDERVQLAVTTLLLSAAGSDERYCRSEIRETYDILEKRFKLSPLEVHRYIECVTLLFTVQGQKRLTRSALQFLKKREYKKLHGDLFKMVTRVVKADGAVTISEVGWLRRFVTELSLTVRDCRKALEPTRSPA